jgi:hypothetical protein
MESETPARAEPASTPVAVVLWLKLNSPNKLKQGWAVHAGTRLQFGRRASFPTPLSPNRLPE